MLEKDEFNDKELEGKKKCGCNHHHDHKRGDKENHDCNHDHHHHHKCGDKGKCGCNHHHHHHHHEDECDHDHDETIIYVTFDDEGDEEVPCVVLDIFECENREYIAISPKAEIDSEEEAEVYFYRFSEDSDEVNLDDIESEEEWNAVADLFDQTFFQLPDDLEE